ncbi:hypothetical protein GXB81_14965 [Paraburkholderia sp. Ac-20336]|uniref:hypothetical protein n=1 Tax=Paraburkholderia sp. Ac-20336 TaxID=2703886 RepID=UPI00197D7D9A|nr:hypothetical protein [Paraburkholderia sp. Ac-20336]MBN3804341.1 hypothetical protein [Paraburkholderia sp. Ac-20336]
MTIAEQEKFRLHVPFEMNGGNLAKSRGAALMLLGHGAKLHAMPALGEKPESPREWIHWLMFDPMTEADAQALVACLRARIPALSVFAGAAGNVVLTLPASGIQKASTSGSGRAFYNGPEITLVAADQEPQPIWAGAYGFASYTDDLLTALNSCPDVTDDCLLAALELWATASHENLPRTKFLTYMTILDSLSLQAKREEAVVRWIDMKIQEAKTLGDPSIVGALGNLKRVSHKAALKALVARAADLEGLSAADTNVKTRLVSELYDARSELSHQGGAAQFDPANARDLAAYVLRAAITAPSILEAEPPGP